MAFSSSRSIGKLALYVSLSVPLTSAVASLAQAPVTAKHGPTFTVAERDLPQKLSLIVYGDMRFTDPANTKDANAAARQALVAKIASEHPDALQLTGDVPLGGNNTADYDVYASETKVWRDDRLRVYPALGNHEFKGPDKQGDLERWWHAFPELTGTRWYSVALGKRVYLLNLDSTSDLMPGSEQRVWLEDQISHLDHSVEFVFLQLHHPPVADLQVHIEVDHNPRPNEISLRDYLGGAAKTSRARFIVIAGHIHNYERFERDTVTYLVSGGGGAHPYVVERTPIDLYQDNAFPNFHYIKFVLEGKQMKATMYRLADATAAVPEWQAKDTFLVSAK